jgi:hypothetical protein
MRFRRAFYRLAPRWLTSGEGELVWYSIGIMLDGMAQRFDDSLRARMPTYAPDDALSYLGRDRKIRRGLSEPRETYASRLIQYLDFLRYQGNPYALMDQLHAFIGKTGVVIRTVDRRGNWYTRNADGTRSYVLNASNWLWDELPESQWSRFWVVIFGAWESQWVPATGARTGTTTATIEEIAGVRAIIRDWKPAGTTCEWILITSADPAITYHPEGSDVVTGDWGNWSKDDPRRPSRNSNARYWKG